MEKHRVSCICYLSKTHFVRDFLQNSIGNSSTSTICNPIYSEGTILELQITMEFHRQLIHQHSKPMAQGSEKTRRSHHWLPEPKMLRLDRAVSMVSETSEAYHQVFKGGILSTAHARNTGETPFTMRNRSDHHDPRMIRPHTRPSRTRRTAEVDHRGSGTDFVWKNIGFRASAISQTRISCETSSAKLHRQLIHQHHLQSHLQCGNDPTVANHNGIPSATHPPAPLAIPFTLRERSYSCKSQGNSVDRTCTKNT